MLDLAPVRTWTWTLACIWSLYSLGAQVHAYIQPPTFLGQLPQPSVSYTFRPTKVHSTSGTVDNPGALVQPSGPSERSGSFPLATLSPNSSITLDFSLNVGGYPIFDFGPIISTSGESATIRYTVSESLSALTPGVGDGSLYKGFAGARFRYEVIPVTPGGERWLGTAIQGGQRFLLVEHISGARDVALREVGFEAATDVTAIENLPGTFNSSDKYLNALWKAGARTVQLGCTSKGSLTPAWQVSAVGTLIESKNIAVHAKSRNWGEIDFSLSLYIISGSIFTFSKGGQFDPEFHLILGDKDKATFSQDTGASINLPSGALTTGKWHDLKFSVRGENNSTMSLSIDGKNIGTIPYGDASSAGPLGFSAGNDTAILVKNLFVQDAAGNTLYSNSLTSMSALEDFSTGTNHYGACFDGAKRDRVVWAGDFSIFGPTIFYSTADIEAVAGSLLLFTGVQDAKGQLSSSVLASVNPSEVPTNSWNSNNFYSYIYAVSSANAWYEWYQYTGDTRFLSKWWPAIKRGINYGLSFIDDTTGLIALTGEAALDFNGYDGPITGTHITTNAILVWALRNMALMADTLGDSVAPEYRTTANKIEELVNKHLFGDSYKAYVLTEGNTTVGISQDGNAYAILSGIAGATSAPSSPQAIIDAMRSLNTPFGPLSFSNTTRHLPIVSPYASGFHTWAAFEAGMGDEAIELMRAVWKNQIDVDNPWYTGMTWEFINGTTGEPYNPMYSSQAHGWGSGPTWQLSRYVLGISPVAPGYSTWSFAPQTVNLTFANGRVPTPWGTIVASWEDKGSEFRMHVTPPAGTDGTITIPRAAKKVTVNGVTVTAKGNPELPRGVVWVGNEGSVYRINVTSSFGPFSITAS